MTEKRNKYNARKVEFKGMIFDSKKEFGQYLFLVDLEKRGKISDLRRQVKYEILAGNVYFLPIYYIADFVFQQAGIEVIQDVKGMRKGSAYSLFKIKQKLMFDKYKIKVQEI